MEQSDRDDCIPAGTYARVHVREVPMGVATRLCDIVKTLPIVVCGLLQHESKMSVLHFRFFLLQIQLCALFAAGISSFVSFQ